MTWVLFWQLNKILCRVSQTFPPSVLHCTSYNLCYFFVIFFLLYTININRIIFPQNLEENERKVLSELWASLIPLMQPCSVPVPLRAPPALASAPAVGGAGFPGIVGQLFLLCCYFSPLQCFLLNDSSGRRISGLWTYGCPLWYFLRLRASICLRMGTFLWVWTRGFWQQRCIGSARKSEIHRWVNCMNELRNVLLAPCQNISLQLWVTSVDLIRLMI